MTEDAAPQTTPPATHPAAKPKPRRRLLRAGIAVMSSVFLLAMLGGLLVAALVGQRMHAPDWLRSEIETRLERDLGGAQIDFGGLEFVVNKGWRPRLRLRDVVLTDPEGHRVAELSYAEASLAMRPLARGQVQPKRIAVSGGLLVLRRDRDGAVSLSMGDGTSPVGQAEGVPQLIESWDRLLLLPNLTALVAVEMEGLSLRYEDARQGRAWTLDGGVIRLTREGVDLGVSASFSLLTGRDYASHIEASYSSRIGETSAEFGVAVTDIPSVDIATQNPVVAWLGVVKAPISGAMRGGVGPNGDLGTISATLQIGAGAVQPTDQSRPIRFDGARTYLTYEPGSQILSFDELSVDSAWISGVSEGRAYLAGVEDGQLTELVGQFTASALRLNPDGLLPEPLVPDAASFDFRLELDPFRMTLGEASISDPAGHIGLRGELTADDEGWHLALDARMDRLTPKRLLEFWPEQAAPKPREWVAKNLLDGKLTDIDVAMRLNPGARPFFAVDWWFEDATIRFNKHQPPVTGAGGQASILGDRLMVTATRGTIIADEGGAVDVSGTSFMIPDMSVKPFTYGLVRAEAKGTVTSILSLLDRPPLAVLKDTPLPVDLADGSVRFAGTVSLPLKPKVPFPEVEFHLDGALLGVRSVELVPNHAVQAEQLHLRADHTQVEISGQGVIDTLPAEMRWRQPIGAASKGKGSRVAGVVELSERTLETFDIGLPKGSVSGEGQAQFELDLKPGAPPALKVGSDLAGVALAIPDLGWRKPPSTTGQLDMAATLGPTPGVDALAIQAAGLTATGTVALRPDGGLEQARLDRVRLQNWLDGSVVLTGRGNAPPAVAMTGGTVDLRNMPDRGGAGGGGGSGGAGPINLQLDQLKITRTLALHGFQAELATQGGGLAGTFRGRLNGQTDVTGRVVPQKGGLAVEVSSADGGGVFRSAGILNQGHGGPFKLSLIPDGPPGHYSGSLRVTNTRIKDAPIMAAMLNAVSVVGLLDEMVGQGILFTEVDARFRLTPTTLTILSSSAIGPSIGLSMDGVFDLVRGRLGMRGVISPVYMLNAIGSVLTRKGEGVIGFSYTLTGPAADPVLQVNPLSGLAPGMFREIFRGGPVPDPSRTAPSNPPGAAQPHDPVHGADGR